MRSLALLLILLLFSPPLALAQTETVNRAMEAIPPLGSLTPQLEVACAKKAAKGRTADATTEPEGTQECKLNREETMEVVIALNASTPPPPEKGEYITMPTSVFVGLFAGNANPNAVDAAALYARLALIRKDQRNADNNDLIIAYLNATQKMQGQEGAEEGK